MAMYIAAISDDNIPVLFAASFNVKLIACCMHVSLTGIYPACCNNTFCTFTIILLLFFKHNLRGRKMCLCCLICYVPKSVCANSL